MIQADDGADAALDAGMRNEVHAAVTGEDKRFGGAAQNAVAARGAFALVDQRQHSAGARGGLAPSGVEFGHFTLRIDFRKSASIFFRSSPKIAQNSARRSSGVSKTSGGFAAKVPRYLTYSFFLFLMR